MHGTTDHKHQSGHFQIQIVMTKTLTSTVALTAVLSSLFMSCGSGNSHENTADSSRRALPDTLRVATLYSPTSYFYYRNEPMGYDYSLVSDLARDKGMVLDIEVANSLQGALAMLDSGKVDLVAYEVPVTAEYNKRVVHAGPTSLTNQVLVQPKSDNPVTDVTELIGRDVYVPADSKYQYRLENLNKELGGGINIHPVSRDTLIMDDMIAMVASGEIPMTVVDSDIARLNRTYYPNLDITMPLSFQQKARWAVRPDHKWLADSIDAYFGADKQREEVSTEFKRYFEISKAIPSVMNYNFRPDRISQYDKHFRKYAPEINWDWRLLASQGYVESRFKNGLTSWAGARGIMQIMPSTARANGVSPRALDNPETSVRVAVKVLDATDRILAKYVPDPEERKLFDLAAYNAGIAHILDAIALAKKYGYDPTKWHNNVEKAMLMKANPKYFRDPVVKYGYFRGRETREYVRQVSEFYQRAVKTVHA